MPPVLITQNPLNINVTGNSKITRRAERAVVTIHVSSDGEDQQKVVSEVTATTKTLQNTLRQLAKKDAPKGESAALSHSNTPPITHWSMSTLYTRSYVPWYDPYVDGERKEKNVKKQYSASTDFEIKFADFTVLGSICTEFANTRFVNVQDISWRLTEKTKASLGGQSRKLAVEDAVAQARDFAEAVGKGFVRPVDIDTDSRDYGFGETRRVGLHAQTREGGRQREQEADILNFEPEEVELSCTVRVKFEAE
jgi:hypothetical protein